MYRYWRVTVVLQAYGLLESTLLTASWLLVTAHPCNMKDFKVYIGITEQNLVEVLHGALKNDTTPEAFPIRYVNNAQVCFPTCYVKIIPLSCVNRSQLSPKLMDPTCNLPSHSPEPMDRIFIPQSGTSRWPELQRRNMSSIYIVCTRRYANLCHFVTLVYDSSLAPGEHCSPSRPKAPETTPSPHSLPRHPLTSFRYRWTSIDYTPSYDSGPQGLVQGLREASTNPVIFWSLCDLSPVVATLCSVGQDYGNRQGWGYAIPQKRPRDVHWSRQRSGVYSRRL
jgi:hypothetical protein